MNPKPTLNQADIDLLNKLLDKRFEEQDTRIEKRLELQDEKMEKRLEVQNEKIEKRLELQDKKIEKRLELQNEKIEERLELQDEKIEKRLDEHAEGIKIYVRQAIQEETPKIVEEKVKHIPTREEYLSGQAKIMQELKIVREEQAAHMVLHDRIEKRLKRVEKKSGLSSAVN